MECSKVMHDSTEVIYLLVHATNTIIENIPFDQAAVLISYELKGNRLILPDIFGVNKLLNKNRTSCYRT
jgi:hypothetical protein